MCLRQGEDAGRREDIWVLRLEGRVERKEVWLLCRDGQMGRVSRAGPRPGTIWRA
jgi:hypothetical protein